MLTFWIEPQTLNLVGRLAVKQLQIVRIDCWFEASCMLFDYSNSFLEFQMTNKRNGSWIKLCITNIKIADKVHIYLGCNKKDMLKIIQDFLESFVVIYIRCLRKYYLITVDLKIKEFKLELLMRCQRCAWFVYVNYCSF